MKKSLFLFVLGLLTFTTSIQAQDWVQVGADIDGEETGDHSGVSISLSSDGSIVAISDPGFHDVGIDYQNNFEVGHVRIFNSILGVWTQIGENIEDGLGGSFGHSISLSSDGSIVAIGTPLYCTNGDEAGCVQIYQNILGTWTKVGVDIEGELSDRAGWSVSLSDDGDIVAIGFPGHEENDIAVGQVRVYKNISGIWTQIGQGIVGEASGGDFGSSVSLNSDGTIVVIGAPYYNGANGNISGQARVYQYISGNWMQIGGDINGEAAYDQFGSSVSISSNGSIVAIGAPYYNEANGNVSGQVRVYQYISGNWMQIGGDINGEVAYDQIGRSVSISSNGSIVAIGAPYYDGANGNDSGQARVYQYISGNWMQIGSDINGEAVDDEFGSSVSISSNGSIVAIGAPDNCGNGRHSGHVRVYENASLGISELQEAGISIYPNPSSGVFNIKNAENYEITITDITGKTVYHTTATAIEQVHLQQRGVYIIHFSSETKRFSYKIIVE